MKKLSMATAGAAFIALGTLGMGQAEAGTLRSWNSATQRGGDLFNAGNDTLQYSAFESALLGRSHTILPGLSTLTEAGLAGVDVFFHGTSSRILTPAESTVLRNFVIGGGSLIIEANSDPSEQASGNSLLAALGLGSPYTGIVGGEQTSTAGTFLNVTSATTVGPLGDLRGLNFGSSLVADINPTGGTLIGTNDAIRAMVEFMPFSGGGKVLAVGDPYGFNLFQRPGDSSFNPNNQKAYLNFIESQKSSTPVPEPSSGLSVLAFAALSAGSVLKGKQKQKA
jgi:hypothetical protein